MHIIAIWDRRRAAPESKTTFCLLQDGRFLTVQPETEYCGTGADGERFYKETGDPEFGDAFPGVNSYDFRKAHFFMKKFGGVLIWIESLDADTDLRP